MPKTLLLADDSVTIQKVVGISLANEDIQLVTVENGDDAVARAREARPDIVLADIVMPGKNGYEVCEAVKSDPALQGVPVLLLTGTFEAFDAERAREAGADGHITKPFEAQALVDQVNQLLARSAPLQTGPAPAAPAPPSPDEAAMAAAGAPRADDAFDFFDESAGAGAAEGGWPTSAAQADAGASLDESSPFGGIDLGGDAGPSVTPGSADDTVLLDTTHAAADPAFDAAVEAAAFDAPGERSDPSFGEADDSGFDLESADLSMASTVPETPAAEEAPPPDLTFSGMPPADASGDPLAELPPEPAAEAGPAAEPAWEAAPRAEAEPVASGVRDLDAEISHDSTEPLAATVPAPPPPAGEDTTAVVEDVEPARVQATPVPVETAPPAGDAGTASLSPEQWQQVHATLEKVAWEAFGDLSEQVVKQALARVEAVAWEVIPQMAETLIREEIARMQGEDDGES